MDRTVGRPILASLGPTARALVHLLGLAKAHLAHLVARPTGPVIDVAIGDRRRARAIARELSRAVARRAAALGFAVPATTSVLVDRRVYQDEREIPSCLDIQARPDQPARYIIRLALSCQGQGRDLDEVFADLNHQVLALYYHLSGDPDRRIVVQASESGTPIGEWERLTALKGNSAGQGATPRANGPAPARPVAS